MPPSASNNGGCTGSNPNMSEDIVHTLSESVQNTCRIDPELFEKYGVKRGLRNADHSGVLVGLTRIGNVVGYEARDGKPIAATPRRRKTVSALRKRPTCCSRASCPMRPNSKSSRL